MKGWNEMIVNENNGKSKKTSKINSIRRTPKECNHDSCCREQHVASKSLTNGPYTSEQSQDIEIRKRKDKNRAKSAQRQNNFPPCRNRRQLAKVIP
jgi:hypothetical protein